jgi:subtilisin family serine protease
MRFKFYRLSTILLSLVLLASQIPFAYGDPIEQSSPEPAVGNSANYRNDQILVTYSHSEDLDDLEPMIEGITPLSEDSFGNEIAVVEIHDDVSVQEAIMAVLEQPGVIAAQPDYLYSLLEVSNDPLLAAPSSWWWLESANAYEAWNHAKSNYGVSVAVFDTGINLYHEDLVNNINLNRAWDAVNNRSLLSSVSLEGAGACGELSSTGHGTHVAGIISSTANNQIGGAGISYNASIVPIRVFYLQDGSLRSSTSILTSAYDYAIGLRENNLVTNLRVINMSLGEYSSTGWDQILRGRVQQAEAKGIMTVAAAGNEGRNQGINPWGSDPIYPSDWPEVFSVVPIDSSGQKLSSADLNQNKNICAPGGNIQSSTYSALNPSNNSYGPKSGSSMASAVVSGAACLLWSVNPSLSIAQIKLILLNTANVFGSEAGELAGFGKLNAGAAVLTTLPSDKDITAFVLAGVTGVISGTTISVNVPYGTNITSLAPTIAHSGKAIYPASSSPQNFTTPVSYTVTAANNSTKTYTVSVIVSPRQPTQGLYIISPKCAPSLVLDIAACSTARGANVQIWANNYSPAQVFRLTSIGSGYFTIANVYSNNMLDVAGAGQLPGTNVHQWEPNSTDAQKWLFADTGDNDGSYYVISACNGLYLDIAGASSALGANVWVYTGNLTNAQKFYLHEIRAEVPTGTYPIYSNLTNSANAIAVDISGGSLANGANVQIWVSNNTGAQRFRFDYNALTGYYTITNIQSNRCLDVAGASAASGTNVWQYTPNNTRAQWWRVVKNSDGTLSIISATGDGCRLDVSGANTNNGANIQIYTPNNTNAQKWRIPY